MDIKNKAILMIVLMIIVIIIIGIAIYHELNLQKATIDLVKNCNITELCNYCSEGKGFYINTAK